MGILKDENGNNIEPLTLTKTKYLPSLEGKMWNNPTEPENSFSQELRLIIKRSKVSVSIMLKESDDKAKYDLFQRLNTGGSHLSPQEVRNCILVMLNKDFFLWLKKLSTYESFQECIALSDRPLSESYDLELVLRFIIFSLIDEAELINIGDVGVFITDKMSDIATQSDFNRDKWTDLFHSTFDKLVEGLGDSAFKRYNHSRTKFMGGFLLSQFEVIAFGLAFNIDKNVTYTDLKQIVPAIWSKPTYIEWSGSGMTATRRLPRLIPFGREAFADGN